MEPRILAKHYLATLLRYSGGLGVLGRANPPGWRVLCYHRVVDPEQVAYTLQPGMYVRPRSFALQMELLARKFNVVPLATLCDALESASDPRSAALAPGTVAITFDDGWLDNYEHAAPILKRLGLPATIFLPTAYIGTDRMFWTDEVGIAITEAKRTPSSLSQLKETLSPEELGKGGGEELIAAARSIASISDIDHLVEYLKRAIPSVRNATLDVLKMVRHSGATPAARSFVSWEEVAKLAESGITFGSHSHEHQNLTELDEGALDADIRRSYELLAEHGIPGGAPFCFPGGYYNELCIEALARADVRYAATTSRQSDLAPRPKLLGRTLIHEDISSTASLFLSRIAGRPF